MGQPVLDRAIVVGVCEATRTFQSNAVMYTTYARAKRFIPQERKVLSYVLARTEPPTPHRFGGGERDGTRLRSDGHEPIARQHGVDLPARAYSLLTFMVGLLAALVVLTFLRH